MLKFLFVLFFFLAAGLSVTAQHKTKQPHRKAATNKQSAGPYKGQPPASPGKNLSFSDALLISAIPANMETILAQKGFKITKQKQPDTDRRIDTFLYRNARAEQLCFLYDNYAGGLTGEIIFQTASQARARQMLADAYKNGYTALDSVTSVSGNDTASFLVRNIKYGIPQPAPVSSYYDTYSSYFTTSESYSKTTPLFSFYFFRELTRQPALIDPGQTGSGIYVPTPPLPVKDTSHRSTDTLLVGTGKPVLLFTEIGTPGRPNYNKDLDQDSVDFFKKRNFFYGTFHRLNNAYPPDQYRYINIYKPTLIRFSNSEKESLYYPADQHSAEFVYWSGKAQDRLLRHPDWQDAEYLVHNITGNNKLKAGYKDFVADSLAVARILSMPVGQTSPQVLQGMNQFIAAAIWKEALLYFPQLDLSQVRTITASSDNITARYFFNRKGQLDSVTNEQRSKKGTASSYSLYKVQYKNGIPYAAYNTYDTAYFRYSGDTVIVRQHAQTLRYQLQGQAFVPIDKFKTGSDHYLRNNIRDYINYNDLVSLEPATEKDIDGSPVVKGEQDYRDIKSKYIFRKGVLQQIHITGKGTDTLYFVLIEKYP